MTVWKPLPGYAGVYWISPEGSIRNSRGYILAGREGKIELRRNGIREVLNIERLTEQVFGGNKK